MKLKYETASLDEIAEPFRPLYTETGGKFVLTGVEGVKPLAEFETVHRSLQAERDAHKATKTKASAWGDLDPTETLSKLDRIKELETVVGGALDDKKIDEIVETRIGSRLGPVERAKAALEKTLADKDQALAELLHERRTNRIRDAVTKAALADKVTETALEDVNLLAERVFDVADDGKIVVKDTGLSPAEWLADQKAKRPHWWPLSTGGGAGGSGGGFGGAANPFTAENWNFTEQGRIIKEKGLDVATRLAKAAGTTVGGPKPKPSK